MAQNDINIMGHGKVKVSGNTKPSYGCRKQKGKK